MDKPPGRSKSPNLTGCGPAKLVTLPITLNISTTTGGNFTVVVSSQNCVDTLKKIVSKKLKVAKDRICLLHRERELQEGTLKANGLQEGSKILLIPNVEAGLLAQRPENTVMQALESLNDSQVNDFLSGKTPLNLSMRLGDHMMLIQLQLSTVNPSSLHNITKPRSNYRRSNDVITSQSSVMSARNDGLDRNSHKISVELDNLLTSRLSASADVCSSTTLEGSNSSIYSGPNINSVLAKQDFENLHNIVKNLTMVQNPSLFADTTVSASQLTDFKQSKQTSICGSMSTTSFLTSNITDTKKNNTLLEQSPIKSLSNLVSTSIQATSIKQISKNNTFPKSAILSENNDCTDPISANLTSCLCKQLSSSNIIEKCECTNCRTCNNTEIGTMEKRKSSSSATNQKSSFILHKTANNTIERSKHRCYQNSCTSNVIRKNPTNLSEPDSQNQDIYRNLQDATSISNNNICNITDKKEDQRLNDDQHVASKNGNEKRTLAEASRNLTQTLRKLSKEVFTNKIEFSDEKSRNNTSGPVIESMKNHGKGIYSGTFSGTLNPALQDRYGRPKRDISTVIHILNDLLSATPHYSRGTRISFQAPSPTRSNKQISLRNQSTSTSDVCGNCFNSTKLKTCTYGECQGHNIMLPTKNQNETNSAILLGHKNNTECQSSTSMCICYKDSKSCNNQMSAGNISSLKNTASLNDRNECTCGFISTVDSTSLADACTSIHNKGICDKCKVELENNKTKYKVEQLKMVMEQRRQRREARKLKNSPYGGRVVSATNVNQLTNNSISLASPNDISSKHIPEELDTAA